LGLLLLIRLRQLILFSSLFNVNTSLWKDWESFLIPLRLCKHASTLIWRLKASCLLCTTAAFDFLTSGGRSKNTFPANGFDTIIQRNTKLGEAPSFGQTIIMHDASSKGSVNYLNLAREILQKNNLTRMKSTDKKISVTT